MKEAHRLAEEINGYIYGETENGGTNTLYVSPIPFDVIDKEIAKGEPHFKPVADQMADGNNLAQAMFIAPFAGAAAALVKWVASLKTTRPQSKTEEIHHA